MINDNIKRDILKTKSTFDEIATAIEQKCVPVGECNSLFRVHYFNILKILLYDIKRQN